MGGLALPSVMKAEKINWRLYVRYAEETNPRVAEALESNPKLVKELNDLTSKLDEDKIAVDSSPMSRHMALLMRVHDHILSDSLTTLNEKTKAYLIDFSAALKEEKGFVSVKSFDCHSRTMLMFVGDGGVVGLNDNDKGKGQDKSKGQVKSNRLVSSFPAGILMPEGYPRKEQDLYQAAQDKFAKVCGLRFSSR